MAKNSKNTKTQTAYASIKEAILTNEFSSETALTEVFLSEKFGLSRTPIREALHQLEQEGFISFVLGKGFFIKKLSAEAVLEIYEMREALEGMAARLCAVRATDAEKAEMGEIVAKEAECLKAQDLKQAMEYDIRLHQTILTCSRNSRIQKSDRSLIELGFKTIMEADMIVTEESIAFHTNIYEAIKNSDPDEAERVMRAHIINSKKYQFNKYYLNI